MCYKCSDIIDFEKQVIKQLLLIALDIWAFFYIMHWLHAIINHTKTHINLLHHTLYSGII